MNHPFSTTCTVCIKVIDEVRSGMSKKDQKDKPAIEDALGKYCNRSDLGPRERKICYYIDPIKRDVSHPFSLGMTSEKVCKRITSSNPEICSVKFPVETQKMETQDLSKLRVKQLKSILADRGVECTGCIEKEEFIKKIQDTAHLAQVEL